MSQEFSEFYEKPENEFLEGFDAFRLPEETDEEAIDRFKEHVYRVVEEKNYWTFLEDDLDCRGVDKKTIINRVLFDCVCIFDVATGDFPSLKFRNNIGKIVRDAFDILLTGLMKEGHNMMKNRKEKDHECISFLREHLENSIYFSSTIPKHPEDKMEFFNSQTRRNRDFGLSDATVGENHARSLEGTLVEKFFALPFATAKGVEYLRSKIDNKRIILFGGGDSMNDLLRGTDLRPREVVNIDPYLDSERVSRNANINYRSIPVSACDSGLADLIINEEEEGFDEIWCSHSVPHYVDNPIEFTALFDNIKRLLKKGGVCRIYPIRLYSGADRNATESAEMRHAYIAQIEALIADPSFNVTHFGFLDDKFLKDHYDIDFKTLCIQKIA